MDTRYPRTAILLSLGLGIAAAAAAETSGQSAETDGQSSIVRPAYDPYEPYNRAIFRFNDTADRYVMQPVARTYQKVTPKPVRSATTNFFNNLRDIVSFGSNLLRGNIKSAGSDFMRVAVNTTFGLGGLIDMAGYAEMPNNKNNLGDTFATWGWKNSNYLVMPLTGPTTVRDGLGNVIVDVYSVEKFMLPEKAVRYPLSGLRAVSKRESLLQLTDSLEEMRGDRYAYTRDLFMSLRNKQVGGTLLNDEENIDDLVSPEDTLPEQTEAKSRTLPETKRQKPAAPPTLSDDVLTDGNALPEETTEPPTEQETHGSLVPSAPLTLHPSLIGSWAKSDTDTEELPQPPVLQAAHF